MFLGTKSVISKKKNPNFSKKCLGTKNIPISQNETHKVLSSVAYCGFELQCLPCMALYGRVWPRMVLLLLFTAIAKCGLIHLSMALCDLVWSFMALFDDLLWSFVAQYRLSRGHRSKFI